MIGKLSGRVEYKSADHVMLDVRGVGYIIHCSDRTLAALPGAGEAAALFTELLVREDLMQLMGFSTLLEKEWYRLLVTVQGVGAKAAMAILGTLGPDGTGRAITLGDWASVKAAPGVGPKIAQRVVNELKDKAPGVMALGGTLAAAQGTVPVEVDDDVIEAPTATLVQPVPSSTASAQSAALSALSNLGYEPAEAASAVATAAADVPDLDEAAMIRAALKLLAPKG